jgi:hypothetical protein
MTSTDWLPHQVISGDATLLSDHDPFDLKGPRSGTSIGRIKIAPAKGTPLVERVEFSNDWLLADLHGVQHDYYQGEGTIDLKVEWRKGTQNLSDIFTKLLPVSAHQRLAPHLVWYSEKPLAIGASTSKQRREASRCVDTHNYFSSLYIDSLEEKNTSIDHV